MSDGLLIHSPANVLSQLLMDKGAGTDPIDEDAWPIYSNGEPSSPDNVITITDTSGEIQGRVMFTGQELEQYGVQIRIRCNDPEDGFAKANALTVTMDQEIYRDTVTLDSDTYLVHAVNRKGGVIVLGKDANKTDLNLYTINVTVTLTRTTI